jgi:hypothetical protein
LRILEVKVFATSPNKNYKVAIFSLLTTPVIDPRNYAPIQYKVATPVRAEPSTQSLRPNQDKSTAYRKKRTTTRR